MESLSGGTFKQGYNFAKISINLNSGWIYSSSSTLLKTTHWGLNHSPVKISIQEQ